MHANNLCHGGWEAGALLGALIDYWHYTGDTQYNDIVTQGLLFQVGPANDYMPPNQTLTEGNDDQGFWGLAVMSAAEYNYPNPPKNEPQWLALAQAVFNTQAPRWDMNHCNGGLRWQIFEWNKGFNYKNSISMACFFALGARLALYTKNSSYADWAGVTWDWMIGTGFMDPETYYVYDGAHIETNCSDIVPYQWSYNAGAFLHGAAAMYNFTERDEWKDRVNKLLEGMRVFFTGPNNDIMTEVACETVDLCDVDQQSFKAYLSRWLAVTTKWAPWTYGAIKPLLEASAEAAIKTCLGGKNQRSCGLKWVSEVQGWDPSDKTGLGQQMAVMEVVAANLIKEVDAPVSADTGGTSEGNPGAGSDDIGRTEPSGFQWKDISTRDKAGAWTTTVIVVFSMLGTFVFMIIENQDAESSKGQKDTKKDKSPDAGLPWFENRMPASQNAGGVIGSNMGRNSGDADDPQSLGGGISSRLEGRSASGAVGGTRVTTGNTVPGAVRTSRSSSESRSFAAGGAERATRTQESAFPPAPAVLPQRMGSRSGLDTSEGSKATPKPANCPGAIDSVGADTTQIQGRP